MEAEFFGYRRGAFTGADRDRDGFFQAAAGGTLFLDEIAELPVAMQVKLLRAIQERRVRKVGATRGSGGRADLVRDPSGAAETDRERTLPARPVLSAQRDRAARAEPAQAGRDIPAIADSILRRIGERSGLPPTRLSEGAIEALKRHPFPGNVRELENILERALALATGVELQAQDLHLQELAAAPAPQAPAPEVAAPPAAPAVPKCPDPTSEKACRPTWKPIWARSSATRSWRRWRAPGTTGRRPPSCLESRFGKMRYRMRRLGLK